ncbi:MAG TPA: hypothetical protein VJK47_01795 [Dehalococcoidales bacterium]|nr:hypothetical protein [Dehalococcoidales bacterium]
MDNQQSNGQIVSGEPEAIRHLRQSIMTGQHWYLALLEAIGQWNTSEETFEGRHYQYLIGGEAFDWLLLAERLCAAVNRLLPEAEKTALLFHGEPPLDLPAAKFKELIGGTKHHQYLNYFYGVTVEEALVLAVEEEVRKERWTAGYHRDKDNTNEAFRRIYGAGKSVMLRRFRREKGYPLLKSIGLTELKDFTYWLFKHRLKQSDKAKVASDTKKALDWLKGRVFSRWLGKRAFGTEESDGLPADV